MSSRGEELLTYRPWLERERCKKGLRAREDSNANVVLSTRKSPQRRKHVQSNDLDGLIRSVVHPMYNSTLVHTQEYSALRQRVSVRPEVAQEAGDMQQHTDGGSNGAARASNHAAKEILHHACFRELAPSSSPSRSHCDNTSTPAESNVARAAVSTQLPARSGSLSPSRQHRLVRPVIGESPSRARSEAAAYSEKQRLPVACIEQTSQGKDGHRHMWTAISGIALVVMMMGARCWYKAAGGCSQASTKAVWVRPLFAQWHCHLI